MDKVLVFSSCTAAKDDSIPVTGRTVTPAGYVTDPQLLGTLLKTRESILSLPEAERGTRQTTAFDLYVRAGRMYEAVNRGFYKPLRQALLEGAGAIDWFFLSGGYGIVHACEAVCKYTATFSRSIATQNGIPYTGGLWGQTLRDIVGYVIAQRPGYRVYVFGSQDYTAFVKNQPSRPMTKVIESTGRPGPFQLSSVLAQFVEALLGARLAAFDVAYPKPFTKLGS